MNDTPQGDGNLKYKQFLIFYLFLRIRMNDTPQGDGNFCTGEHTTLTFTIRMNDTPQGDGN